MYLDCPRCETPLQILDLSVDETGKASSTLGYCPDCQRRWALLEISEAMPMIPQLLEGEPEVV